MKKDELEEFLSAYLDNELSCEEEKELLLQVEKNPELKKKLNNFQLIKSAVKHELPPEFNIDLASKVMQQIEDEKPVQLKQFKPGRKVEKQRTFHREFMAMAAILVVAVTAIVIYPQFNQSSGTTTSNANVGPFSSGLKESTIQDLKLPPLEIYKKPEQSKQKKEEDEEDKLKSE